MEVSPKNTDTQNPCVTCLKGEMHKHSQSKKQKTPEKSQSVHGRNVEEKEQCQNMSLE